MPKTLTTNILSRLSSAPITSWGLYRQSLLFAELAMLAYFDEAITTPAVQQIGFTTARLLDVEGAQAYIFETAQELVVAFRGTEATEWNDIKADVNAWPVIAETIGRVHRGFKAEVDTLWPLLADELRQSTKDLWFCGHSLGAAMATICANRCKLSQVHRDPIGLFTYGSPRVGSKKYVQHGRVHHVRWVNNNDIVTRVPPVWMGYYHVGREMYLNAYGKVRRMTKYQRLKDRYRGFKMGLKQGKVDHFADHAIVRYVQYIQQAFLQSSEAATV
jgi:triacylglycerol lipase